MTTEMLKIDLPKNQSSIIKVMGVGGGGGNAVNHMFKQGIKGVDFIVCNTDSQHLVISPVPNKIQLGVQLTQGLGAGSIPQVGRDAALEDIEKVKEILSTNTRMLFITAGMGGGTGTGAAPVIAAAAKEMGILTVGIVTMPFSFEGKKRLDQADAGIQELKEHLDTLLLISNDKLRACYSDLTWSESFAKADDVLTTAAKGIAEIITKTGRINVDFADIKTVMTKSGAALMGNGAAEGPDRAVNAVVMALASPLLNDTSIKGAKNVLLNITSGVEEIRMDEISAIADHIQNEAGSNVEIIWGLVNDESLGNKINITLLATGFDHKKTELVEFQPAYKMANLEAQAPKKTNVYDPYGADNPAHQVSNTLKTVDEPKIAPKSAPISDPGETTFSVRVLPGSPKAPGNEPKDQGVSRIRKQEPTLFPSLGLEPDSTDDIQAEKKKERDELLKALSQKIKTAEGWKALEEVPAYMRREVQLVNTPHSSESQISRLSLNQDGDRPAQIKSNNSFLHDNVD